MDQPQYRGKHQCRCRKTNGIPKGIEGLWVAQNIPNHRSRLGGTDHNRSQRSETNKHQDPKCRSKRQPLACRLWPASGNPVRAHRSGQAAFYPSVSPSQPTGKKQDPQGQDTSLCQLELMGYQRVDFNLHRCIALPAKYQCQSKSRKAIEKNQAQRRHQPRQNRWPLHPPKRTPRRSTQSSGRCHA